jgi:hypothetical protein
MSIPDCESLLSYEWDAENVIYNVSNANLHLLSSFNAALLQSMKKEMPEKELVVRISHFYQLDEIEAQSIFNELKFEFDNLGLLD